jgi:tRNA(Ile2) C34 agmatinyltransferase TiaS
VTPAEDWTEYLRGNKTARDAYLARPCPDCGDIAESEHQGERCKACKRRLRSVS